MVLHLFQQSIEQTFEMKKHTEGEQIFGFVAWREGLAQQFVELFPANRNVPQQRPLLS